MTKIFYKKYSETILISYAIDECILNNHDGMEITRLKDKRDSSRMFFFFF